MQKLPTITHLLFVDDSILYCKATMQESIELVDILQKYKEASRKKINRSKKQVFNEVKKRVGKKLILKALLCIFILKASIFLVH